MRRSVFYLALACGLAAAQQLPQPYATPSAANGPKIIPRPENAQFHVPNGFQVEEYAAGFIQPRFMLLGPAGEVLLSDSKAGAVYALQNRERKKLIEGLERPYGLAIWKDYLYIGEATSIKRYKYDPSAATLGKGEEIVSLAGFTQAHWTRSLLFDRKGEKLYIGVGSGANVEAGEDPRRAAIHRCNPDGTGQELFAEGTRNPIGLHWAPGADTLFAAIQERDGLGDDLVPDFLTHIEKGGFYGWPYAYIGPNEEPRLKGQKPELVAKTIVPDLTLGPHVAVLDFTFYTGKQFPREYQGGAFLAFHGSSNRAKRVGYSIAYVPFKNGRPAGPPSDFLTGWMLSPDSKEVWGRPVAVLQLADGSLLVSDDGAGKLWRISYKK